MECMTCDSTKPMKVEATTHKYRESGLDNIILVGVQKFKCEECGEEHFNFGNVDQLHSIIAEFLIKKDTQLTGKEARFLRVKLGYSADMLANLLGYSKDHIYRFENESVPMQQSFDRVLRFAYVNKTAPDRYYDLHDAILNGTGVTHIDSLRLRLSGDHWEKEAA